MYETCNIFLFIMASVCLHGMVHNGGGLAKSQNGRRIRCEYADETLFFNITKDGAHYFLEFGDKRHLLKHDITLVAACQMAAQQLSTDYGIAGPTGEVEKISWEDVKGSLHVIWVKGKKSESF